MASSILGEATGQPPIATSLWERASRYPICVPFHVQLHAVAVAEGLGRHGRDLRRGIDLPEAAQFLAQDAALGLELELVGRVLVVAAAADAEHRAGRSHAVGRGIQHLQHPGADQARLFLLGFGPDAFAGQHERREDHAPVNAA